MKILVSVDGSEFSRAAIEKCCEVIVSPEDTAIKIVSVYEVVEPIDISISPEFSKELEDAARKKAEGFADEAAARIRERFPNIDISTEISTGSPERAVLAEAEEWRADLIVIAPHGRGFWGRTLLGSVTDSLVHNAHCSVLVARDSKLKSE